MATKVYMKVGDTSPQLTATLENSDGTAIDLSGGSVVFRMMTSRGQAILSSSATIVTAASGIVRYDWVTADTARPGKYLAEFVATLASGRIVTVPSDEYIEVIIEEKVTT